MSSGFVIILILTFVSVGILFRWYEFIFGPVRRFVVNALPIIGVVYLIGWVLKWIGLW
jgi:hypothetical protein